MTKIQTRDYAPVEIFKTILKDVYLPVLAIGIAGGVITFIVDYIFSIYGNPLNNAIWLLIYGFILSFLSVGILTYMQRILQLTEATIAIIWTWLVYVFVYTILYTIASVLGMITFAHSVGIMDTFIIWILIGTINAIFWKFMAGVFGYTKWYTLSSIKVGDDFPVRKSR